jgi:hypothetical protein
MFEDPSPATLSAAIVKIKTALRDSKTHAKVLAVIVAVLAGVVVFFPTLGGLICLGFAALGLAMEVINILYITRKSRSNPDYLEEKIS